MIFSSLTFLLLFFPITFFLYFFTPVKFKTIFLIIISFLFYAWGEPFYIFLLLALIIINYKFGLLLFNSKNKKLILIFSIIINVLVLGFFKYGSFFISNIENLFNINLNYKFPQLPLGVSFFTFSAISYLVDVFNKKIKPKGKFAQFVLYISFFPKLISGPIARYQEIESGFKIKRSKIEDISIGLRRFVLGLAKKVLIADKISIIATGLMVANVWDSSIYLAWFGVILFGLQIYYDFSGYTDMAIGIARVFGFNLPENFNQPYLSKSVSEFWRRWHITLGSWFRDYVYIPLGGNRVKTIINLRNLLIVWVLTGLWHGASWNFVLWGLYFGVFIILEKYFLTKILEKLPKLLNWLYASILIFAGWALFIPGGFKASVERYTGLFVGNYTISQTIINELLYAVKDNWVYIFLAILFVLPTNKIILAIKSMRIFSKYKYLFNLFATIFIVLIFWLSISNIISSSTNVFIYFGF